MAKVIATDLDGTLFYPKKRLSMVDKKNRAFLKRFSESGGRILISSSRSEQFYAKMKEKLDFPVDFVGCDGTFVFCDGKKIFDKAFEVTSLKRLIADLRDHYDPPLMLLTTREAPLIMTKTKVSHWTNFVYFLYQSVQGVYREPVIRSDHFFYGAIEKGGAHKLMVLIGLTAKKKELAEKITDDLRRKYPEFEFMWLDQFIEITPKGCSKGAGVAFYLDYLGISHDNVMVVGDSGNDVSMFEAFYENSYCMDHAPESVRAKAKNVVSRVYELESKLYPSVDSKKTEKEE